MDRTMYIPGQQIMIQDKVSGEFETFVIVSTESFVNNETLIYYASETDPSRNVHQDIGIPCKYCDILITK